MSNDSSFFGSRLARELSKDELAVVSGGGGGGWGDTVVLPPGSTTPTDTATDDGRSCDGDTDWAGNAG